MAIQVRRGVFDRFDKNGLLPGEWAVVLSGDPDATDGRSVYVCFSAGTTKRMATYEDMVANIQNVLAALEEAFTADVVSATNAANSAAGAASTSKAAADVAAEAATAAAIDARQAAAEARGVVMYLDWVADEDGDEILAVIDTTK